MQENIQLPSSFTSKAIIISMDVRIARTLGEWWIRPPSRSNRGVCPPRAYQVHTWRYEQMSESIKVSFFLAFGYGHVNSDVTDHRVDFYSQEFLRWVETCSERRIAFVTHPQARDAIGYLLNRYPRTACIIMNVPNIVVAVGF